MRGSTVRSGVFLALAVLFFCGACAKVPKSLKSGIMSEFVPSEPQAGLLTATEALNMDKLKSFVVIEKDGVVPAERAFYLITPGEYDYRPSIVENGKLTTRFGKIYTYLPRGVVMAVADVVFFGREIFFRLLSIEKIPSSIHPKMKATRVAIMLGFKFDKATIENSDTDEILATIKEWMRPFSNIQDALRYSETVAPRSMPIPAALPVEGVTPPTAPK